MNKIEDIKKLTPEERKRDRFYHQYLRRVPSMLFPLISQLQQIRDMTLKPHVFILDRKEIDFIFEDLERKLKELKEIIDKNCVFKEDYLLKEI